MARESLIGTPSRPGTPVDLPSRSCDTDLQMQVRLLQEEVSRLKSGTVPSDSILDQKLPEMKKTALACKPSRTIWAGPLNRFCLFSFRPSYGFLLGPFEKYMVQELRAWKRTHSDFSHVIRPIYDGVDTEDTLSGYIDEFLVASYDAIKERLLYFQTGLNDLLYRGFIPMESIYALFFERFPTCKMFNRPPKHWYYADVSLICMVAYITNVFTKLNGERCRFKYEMSCTQSQLSTLAVRLLNFAEFRKKRTEQALLSLVILRSSVLSFENSEGPNEEVNSYPIFQLTLDLCYQMGIHRNPDDPNRQFFYRKRPEVRAKSMASRQLKELWNYMQWEDVNYSLTISGPLLIDYNYCEGYFDQGDSFRVDWGHSIQILREILCKINSKHPISINEALALHQQVLALYRQLPFALFRNELPLTDKHEFARIFRFKLMCMQLDQGICGMIFNVIEQLLKRGKDTLELRTIYKQMYEQIQLIGLTALSNVQMVYSGGSMFGSEPDNLYIIFLREVVSRVMDQTIVVLFGAVLSRTAEDLGLSKEFAVQDSNDTYIPVKSGPNWEGSIDITNLENALFEQDSSTIELLVNRLISSTELLKFSGPFYDVVAKHVSIRESLDTFVLLKMMISWTLFVEALTDPMTPEAKIDPSSVFKRTKDRLREFNVGRLDEKLQLTIDNNQLEQFIESFFKDQDWSMLLSDVNPHTLLEENQPSVEWGNN